MMSSLFDKIKEKIFPEYEEVEELNNCKLLTDTKGNWYYVSSDNFVEYDREVKICKSIEKAIVKKRGRPKKDGST